MVADPMEFTAATRMPAMMTGSASGSCTRNRIWVSVMPMPLAASIMLWSMLVRPV